jgi:hypothetical protein
VRKILAYYLPQFHEFEENNKWWGKGFTEWTCVKRTKPLYEGHIVKRPHPDIGYYCLEDVGVRRRQAELAKKYGVHGFCYYHYWFGDKPLMEKPLEMMLEDGQPDLPFCLCWANEPWRRRMNGGNDELLKEVQYGGEEEWERHLQYLRPFFQHKNYIRINGRPLFLIYRVSQVENFVERMNYWREAENLFIVMTIGNFHDDVYVPFFPHVDALVDFFPNWLGIISERSYLKGDVWHYDMTRAHDKMLHSQKWHDKHFKGMMVGFDSYPRAGKRSNIFSNNKPSDYQQALARQLERSEDEFVFLNAWNEWGEGCCLEPDEHYGYAWLEATRMAVATQDSLI